MTTTYPISQAYSDGQVLTAANVNSIAGGVNDLAALQINTQTTSYTLVLSDAAKVINMSASSGTLTLTVPANSTVAFAVGTQVMIYQGNTTQVTVAGTSSNVNFYASRNKLAGTYAVACLMKVATDTWVLFGNVTA